MWCAFGWCRMWALWLDRRGRRGGNDIHRKRLNLFKISQKKRCNGYEWSKKCVFAAKIIFLHTFGPQGLSRHRCDCTRRQRRASPRTWEGDKGIGKSPLLHLYIYTRACARGRRKVAEPRLRPARGGRGLAADKEKAATPVGKCCGSYRDW